MTYVNNENVDCAVRRIINLMDTDKRNNLEDDIRSIIGRYLGIRTEDGKERFYDIVLLEGEEYVMDG